MIYGHLNQSDALSLDIALDAAKETVHMNKFLRKHMPIPVLAAQQIIHQSGAQINGSYEWAQYSACKRAWYRSSNYSDESLSRSRQRSTGDQVCGQRGGALRLAIH
jgi:hypothetical protein